MVPEAALNEDNGFPFRKNDVGLARKIRAMKAETKPGSV
jgi:hypothetical protein